ncbi:ABC1 family protein C21C3.03, mitochondrial [Grifola frondosa]|uniref:ABC1 family protein C21C3.03, mitochondrial n=1 Tax=Grifola frondosa TaxID=5627 RepID=A0A1C7MUS4_GRIFR|nr:ABC1 family protein C21C3.03, mitochondrial [Grifola frondosa]
MAFRLSALPPGLRHATFARVGSLSSRHASRCTSSPSQEETFMAHSVSWRICSLCHPQPRSPVTTVLASPTIIPCPAVPVNQIEPTILSPAEADRSLIRRIITFLHERILEPILTARRFIYLFCVFVPVMLASPMLLVGHPDASLSGDRWGAVWWYGFLTSQMQRAGPTFTKVRFTHVERRILYRTQERVIEDVFQRPFDDVFEDFDETPIGTGAIAQSNIKTGSHSPSHLTPKRHRKHRGAVLPPSLLKEPPPSVPTAAVAIKVLHPRVAKMINRDLNIMSFFAHVITFFPGMQWLSLPEEVAVFGQMMHEQIDLRHEADNLAAFEKHFDGRKLPVTFPRPLTVWSTQDLLVEEYQNALPMEAFLKNGGGPFNDSLAEIGLDAFLNMLLLDNFVHSDLHPGNIMIKFSKPTTTLALEKTWTSFFGGSASEGANSDKTPQSASDAVVDHLRSLMDNPPEWRSELDSLHAAGYLPEVVFVDAGLVTTLNGKNRQNFLDLFRAVAEFDGYRAGLLMVERCRTPELAVDTETFALRMQHIVLNVKRKTFSLGQIKISDILMEVLRAVRKHHVKMEGDFAAGSGAGLVQERAAHFAAAGEADVDARKYGSAAGRKYWSILEGRFSTFYFANDSTHLRFLQVWVWLEAREFASAAFIDADELVRYDWLTPSV